MNESLPANQILTVILNDNSFQASLGKLYQCLAETQWAMNQVEEVLATLANGLIADPGHVTSIVQSWVCMKKKSTNQEIDVMNRFGSNLYMSRTRIL